MSLRSVYIVGITDKLIGCTIMSNSQHHFLPDELIPYIKMTNWTPGAAKFADRAGDFRCRLWPRAKGNIGDYYSDQSSIRCWSRFTSVKEDGFPIVSICE